MLIIADKKKELLETNTIHPEMHIGFRIWSEARVNKTDQRNFMYGKKILTPPENKPTNPST
ncbi:hypothetical protein ACO0K0_08505 [Undibacterium sp. SXout11W]|uniref:hypothetical protein n=1 Tax=Undibacterium sp. SXout11W TaxID=3413050 RepID=UPI003BF428D4